MKSASEFGYSKLVTHESGYWIPALLHRRCKPCHEQMREKLQQRIPCVICGQGRGNVLDKLDGYEFYGGGTKINLCCRSCLPDFKVLPESRQRFYIHSRINLAFPSPQVIYAESDPLSQDIRYVGRTGRVKRRHNEHKRNIHQEQPIRRDYDLVSNEWVETPWYSRANWMYDLAKKNLSPVQKILLDVEPAAYVIEYEQRYILHAIQQGWPILNSEMQGSSVERVRASLLDFLYAPFADLVTDKWFSAKGIEAFIRKWY